MSALASGLWHALAALAQVVAAGGLALAAYAGLRFVEWRRDRAERRERP